jgi:hypothetical protein
VVTTFTWPEGEYPKIDPVQVGVLLATKGGGLPVWPASWMSACSDVVFVHIRDPIGESYKLEGNTITLKASRADVSQSDEPVIFIGKRQRRLTALGSVVLGLGAITTQGLCSQDWLVLL